MASGLLEFTWGVHTNGYEWSPSPYDDEVLHLKYRHPLGFMNLYKLSQTTGLFRTFAFTNTSHEGIAKFANKYGLLGSIEPSEGGKGEVDRSWQWRILAMRRAIKIWDLAKFNEEDRLAEHFTWNKNRIEYRDDTLRRPARPDFPPAEDAIIFDVPNRLVRADFAASGLMQPAFSDLPWTLLDRLVPGDVVKAAHFFVQWSVNGAMFERVSPAMFWDETTSRLEFNFVPDCLGAGLWVQFARAISGNKTYDRCQTCDEFFERSAPKTRSTRKYCSTACRLKAYRDKKLQAQQLHGEGLSFKKIAAQLSSDEDTVKGWIKGGKR